MIDGNDFILIVGMVNFNIILFYFGVVNFNKYRLLKKGFHDKQIQGFVDSSVPDKNTFKKKFVFYFSLCAVSWGLMLVFVYGGEAFNEVAKVQAAKAIEIRGGKEVNINGDNLPIFGDSQCLSDDNLQNCIVIKPETKVVAVWVGYPDGVLKEAWTIKKVGDQVLVTSGKGSYVFEAK